MISSEGESFTFRTVVPVEGPVESWMLGVEAEMRRTLAAVTKEGKASVRHLEIVVGMCARCVVLWARLCFNNWQVLLRD